MKGLELKALGVSALKTVPALVAVLGPSLYYIGKRYTEAYYRVLGVPAIALPFGLADYEYAAALHWAVFALLAVAAVAYMAWRVLRHGGPDAKPRLYLPQFVPRKVTRREAWSRYVKGATDTAAKVLNFKKGDPSFFPLGMFFYFCLATIVVIAQLSVSLSANIFAESFVGLMLPVILLGFLGLLLVDTATMQYVLVRRRLWMAFVGAALFALVVSLLLLPAGLGGFAGILDSAPARAEQVFPSMVVTSDKPLFPSQLDWQEEASGVYRSEPLFLILESNDGWFVTPKKSLILRSDTLLIRKSDSISIQIEVPRVDKRLFPYGTDNATGH